MKTQPKLNPQIRKGLPACYNVWLKQTELKINDQHIEYKYIFESRAASKAATHFKIVTHQLRNAVLERIVSAVSALWPSAHIRPPSTCFTTHFSAPPSHIQEPWKAFQRKFSFGSNLSALPWLDRYPESRHVPPWRLQLRTKNTNRITAHKLLQILSTHLVK